MTDILDQNKMKDDLNSIAKEILDDAVEEIKKTEPTESADPPDNSDNPTSSGKTESKIKYPNIDSALFKDITTKTKWWEDKKEFLAYCILALLSAFVFCKGFCILKLGNAPSGFLLFFFGVIVLLVIGLIMLAYFMKKTSTKHHDEKDERENKQLAFRQKMMEKVFELENNSLITEKLKQEKLITKKEKDDLYSLDEKLRLAEHNHKMQLRKYEFVENYMKNEVELAKIEEKKKVSSIHLGDDFEISMVNPVAKIEKVPENGEEKEYYRISFEKNS